ncbi:MAG: ABC transporter ATP-binding protein [Chloroflexi bacterium]|nr:ABC transporter ATP-binding protein [Chloroflexota bacterium]PWB43410.1 MAG: macrolide ABC transporter ATP-binding protein [Dehalococcoidia bacterium]
MSATALVEARGLSVSYGETKAVRSADIRLDAGDRVALMGASGSGKSTLLHCLAGVLPPDEGEVWFEGQRLNTLRDGQRSDLRLRRMGVVFQFGDLVPELTLVENVMLPLLLTGQRRDQARRAAMDALDALGVAAVAERRAGAVSGGQAQRAAVARAVVHEPAVIFADEPTGSLDTVNAEAVLDVLVSLATDRGTALLVVTHDHQVASHLDRLVTMRDGAILEPAAARR